MEITMHESLLTWKPQVRTIICERSRSPIVIVLWSSQSFNGHLETCDLSIATSKDLCTSFNLDSSHVNMVNQNRAKYHRYASRKDLESLKSGDLDMMLSGLRRILKRITFRYRGYLVTMIQSEVAVSLVSNGSPWRKVTIRFKILKKW